MGAKHLLDPRVGIVEIGGDVFDVHDVGGFAGLAALLDRHQPWARNAIFGDQDFFAGRRAVYEGGEMDFCLVGMTK